MKIGYFADGPWSHEAIKLIAETPGLTILFIVPRFDTQDPILQKWAKTLNVPFIPHENVNSDIFIKEIKEYDADLFISMSFNQILKKEIIDLPPLGFINCHAGALPFYRGRNPLNWVLINDEKHFGITVHYVDEGIDTGDIIEQRLFPIVKKDNYNSLLNLAISECAITLHSAILKILDKKVKVIKQKDIHPIGTYFGMRTVGDEIIDLNWPAIQIFNFIRAINQPGPCARCYIAETEYAMVESELIEHAPSYIATVGEVIGRSTKGIVIKVGDSSLLITLMATIENGLLTKQFVPKFSIGTRFQLNKRI
jgi:methionyl-tRNA formyltransferase